MNIIETVRRMIQATNTASVPVEAVSQDTLERVARIFDSHELRRDSVVRIPVRPEPQAFRAFREGELAYATHAFTDYTYRRSSRNTIELQTGDSWYDTGYILNNTHLSGGLRPAEQEIVDAFASDRFVRGTYSNTFTGGSSLSMEQIQELYNQGTGISPLNTQFTGTDTATGTTSPDSDQERRTLNHSLLSKARKKQNQRGMIEG